MKWVLIPGLGTDRHLFDNIEDLLPHLQIVEFELPSQQESIEEYANRLGDRIVVDGPLVLGGVSFGGMLASILCERFQPVCLVLMSSTHRPEALSNRVRVFEWMSRLMPDTLVSWLRGLGHYPAKWLEPMNDEQLSLFKKLALKSPLENTRQGGRMIMQWKKPPRVSCPIYHLHGARDPLMLLSKVSATHIVQDAGHLMNITHPEQVRQFITEIQRAIQSENFVGARSDG